MNTKIRHVREVRNGIPVSKPMRAAIVGDALIVADDEGVNSILRGKLRSWVDAHLTTVESGNASVLEAPGAISVLPEDPLFGPELIISSWPESFLPSTIEAAFPTRSRLPPATVAAAPIEQVIIQPPAEIVSPIPDIPTVPTTTEDWRTAIMNAKRDATGVIPPITAGESPGDYATRALAPLGYTIADVAASGQLGTPAIVAAADHPDWAPILEAAADIKAPL